MKSTYALLVTAFAAQQATATWDFFANLNTPNYCQNECSDKQKAGFSWSDLKDGSGVSSYGDFSFSSGWTCANSFGKRDIKSKRTFGNKCIKNTVTKEKPASFGCESRGFSITHMDVSSEFDAEIELHYKMDDGSICKQHSSCSAGGSTLQNTQCGGAKSVDIYLGSHFSGSQESCEIGFHNIGFDCSSSTPYTTPAPPVVYSTSTKVASSTLTIIKSTTPAASSATSTPEASTTSAAVPFSSPAPFTNSSMSASSPAVQSSIATHKASTFSSAVIQSSSTAVTVSTVVVSSAVASTTGTSVMMSSALPSHTSYPPVNITDIVPKCMNSWLQISASGCKDNTDSSCYCVKAEFTKNVIDCISSWCGNDHDTSKALQFFIGICAAHVPSNPGIISDCPSYIPLTSTVTSTVVVSTGVATGSSMAPSQTNVMTTPAAGMPPAPQTTPCTTITYGNSTITVPQVHFTTQPNDAGTTPTQPVALVPGNAPAQTTPASGPAGAPYPTSVGTATLSMGYASGTGAANTTSPAQFTGAASPFGMVPKGAMFGAALAFLAL